MDLFNGNKHEAASMIAALAYKRERDNLVDGASVEAAAKRPKPDEFEGISFVPSPLATELQTDPNPTEETELKPYPFFYYRDYSRVADSDALIPLTPPGRY
jgi:hypothetical protein